MQNNTYERNEIAGTLEQYEWDSLWMEHTEDRISPRILYIGDSISIPTRERMNALLGTTTRVDGFATSKAVDNPHFAESLRLFAAQQVAPCRIVLFNNGLHGWHLEDDGGYLLHYEQMLGELRATFPQAIFLLLLTTPVEDPARDRRVCRRNAAVKTLAEKYKLPVADLYHAHASLPALLSADGVHFTDEGYRLLAETVTSAVKSLLP